MALLLFAMNNLVNGKKRVTVASLSSPAQKSRLLDMLSKAVDINLNKFGSCPTKRKVKQQTPEKTS